MQQQAKIHNIEFNMNCFIVVMYVNRTQINVVRSPSFTLAMPWSEA